MWVDVTLTPEHFDKASNLIARGPIFLVQKLLPLMTGGGSVVLVSSGTHVMGIPGHTAYAAPNAALRSYAAPWAAELKGPRHSRQPAQPCVTDTAILDNRSAAREALVDRLGFAPIELAKIGNGGLLIQVWDSTWAQLTFQDLTKFD